MRSFLRRGESEEAGLAPLSALCGFARGALLTLHPERSGL